MAKNYLLHYERDHFITMNDMLQCHYYFDYGERSFDINMEFQHYHAFYEIMILLSPQAQHLIKGIPYDIVAGDLVLLPPSVLHKSIYPEGEPSKRLIVNFILPDDTFNELEYYKPLLNIFEEEVPIFRFEPHTRKRLFAPIDDIFTLTKSTSYEADPTSQMIIHMKFINFLYDLVHARDENIYIPHNTCSPKDMKIYDIAFYIHNHYHEDLSLASLAKQFFLSPCYLSHQFKEVTNFTLTHYIQISRIQNAKYLLQNTDFSITEIAQRCGFQSFSQFNRIFRRECQVSPSEFRKTGISWKPES
ncbi:AraC family transcriptional regulator [Cellulosilyticum sp. ST5]|uniref:helix-turn-helix transcriptional regulator n=1 Tax=unclassified Cellulosilyticum TaxID=2643091 RepID=UPI000F8E85DB|nr:AraC family transcriptional regulator [Cellulosilyticum sp. WCF-2]QEH68082.1 AraC family transcriptional regulator [Cellulosilyticum sp. WCF-2]